MKYKVTHHHNIIIRQRSIKVAGRKKKAGASKNLGGFFPAIVVLEDEINTSYTIL